jgi:hypothetical protein
MKCRLTSALGLLDRNDASSKSRQVGCAPESTSKIRLLASAVSTGGRAVRNQFVGERTVAATDIDAPGTSFDNDIRASQDRRGN